eukprot:jgi/Hompol1/4288/HPOL_007030-RA
MGFAEDVVRAAISVNKPSDKQRILDFVIKAAELRSAGYEIDAVKMALTAYDPATSDPSVVLAFLEAYAGIAELGFQPAEIQNALVKKNNNKVDAIEYLMGS